MRRVPAEPIAEIVREWEAREGSLVALGEKINDSHGGNIAKLRRGERKFIEFDTADTIVCMVLGPQAWHQRPELAEIWNSINLTCIDIRKPTCSKARRHTRRRIRRTLKQCGGSVVATARCLDADPETVRRGLGWWVRG